jgi:uncharacterized repeat protein (TIGR01451 family)
MPAVSSRRGRRLQVAVFVVLSLFLAGARAAFAGNTCTWTGLGGANWSASANWLTCGGTYPGAGTGDRANVAVLATINVDVMTQPVILDGTLSPGLIDITIPGSGALFLASGSAAILGRMDITITGGTLGVGSGASITNLSANVTLNSGTINSLGTLTLSSGTTFAFNSGTLQGAGTFGVASGATANFAGSGAMAINTGLNFTNAGNLNLSSDTTITSDNVSNPGISNSGTMTKTGGSVVSQINCRVDNTGTVNVGAFKIYLAGGGTHTGSFTGAGTIAFNGSHQLNSTANVSGVGAVHIAGGTLFSNIASLTLPATHQFAGTLSTNGAITINALYIWDTGTLDGLGAPSPSLTVTSFGGMNITGSAGGTAVTNGLALTANGSAINFQSTVTGPLALNNGGSIVLIAGSNFNIQNSNGIGITTNGVGSSQIQNTGSTVTKSTGGITQIDAPYVGTNSSAALTVNAGTLKLTGGGSSLGTITSAGGATLEVAGGSFAANGPLAGLGTFALSAGTLTVGTSATVQNFTEVGGALSIAGPNSLTVNGTLNFNGGTMSGNGVTNAAGTLNIGNAAPTSLDLGMTLNVTGTAQYNADATNYLTVKNAGRVFVNNSPLGTFNFNTTSLVGTDGVFGSSFDNSGIVNKNTAATTTQINSNFTNGGTVNVLAGALNLSGGGTSNAAFNVSSGATMAFNAGGYGLSVGSSLSGAGNYNLTGTGFLNVNTPITSPAHFNQDNGVLNLSADFTLPASTTYAWTGGIMFVNPGFKTVVSGGSLLINTSSAGVTLDGGGDLNYNSGVMQWVGTNSLTMKQNSSINISSLFDIQASGTIVSGTFGGGSAIGHRRALGGSTNTITVNPGGTLLKSTAGQMVIAADVTNAGGTISATAGLLALSGTASVTHTGTFNAGSGATLDFSAGTHAMNSPVSFTGTGLFKVHGATVNFNALSTPMANLLLATGTIGGTGNASTTSTFTWDGGTIAAPLGMIVSSGTGALSGANGALALGGTVTISGGATASYTSANALTVSGQIVNNGNFNYNSAADLMGGGTFTNNSGAQYQYQPTATHTFAPVFSNAGGTVKILNGTENFTSSFTQGSGTTTLGPGNMGASPFNLNGGILNGNGTITGDVNNAGGNLNPGTSPGSITVNGNYTQSGGGTINIDLNGTNPGTQYDQLVVSGIATLGGTLNATLGYAPGGTDSFDVVTFASRVSDFGTYSLPPIPGPPPGTIGHTLTGSAVRLLALIPQADLAVTQSASPTLILHNQNSTFNVTVTNNGPSVASGIVVTNVIVGGAFVSYSAPTCTGAGPNCTIPSLGPGASETIAVTVTGNAVGTMSNTASATTTSATDPNLTNNSATANVTVNGSADLSIAVSGPGSAPAASNVTYTVTVGNIGPDPAIPAVTLSVIGGTLISASGAGFICGTPASCAGAVLNPPGTATLTVVAQAQSQAGAMVLTASVGPLPSDPNVANNLQSATTTITALADLLVTKALTTPMIAGTTVTYAITVKNIGPSDSESVTLNDPTPGGLTFVSADAPCSAGFPCSLGTVAAGSMITINANYSLPASASGTITNVASVSSSATPDPNSLNDSVSLPAVVVQKADVSVTKSGPGSTQPGSSITYNITVTNNGPSNAASVQLDDTYSPPGRLTFVSATGACSSFPCALGNLNSGQSVSVQATYKVVAGVTTTIVNTAVITAGTPDPNVVNNSASASAVTGCPTSAPAGLTPADGATNAPLSGLLSWSDVNSSGYTVYLDEVGPNGSCSKFLAATGVTSQQYVGLKPGTTYQWRVEAVSPGCSVPSSICQKFTTASTCPTTAPTLISPINTSISGSANFSWSSVGGAVDYKLFLNGTLIATTTSTTFGPVPIGTGVITWYVIAEFTAPCTSLQSQTGSFSGCDLSVAPVPSLVSEAAPGQGYDYSYNAFAGATGYQVDESTDPNFPAAQTTSQTVTSTKVHFQHSVNVTTAFYYRVRAILGCGTTPFSVVIHVVIAPFTPPTNPNVSVPVGSKSLVEIPVHVPGFAGQTLPFTATLDNRPWFVRVQPSSGALPPEGIDLIVFADPTGLPNGTFTGTVILFVTTPGSGTIINQGVTPVSVPVSISLVTPVTPKPAGPPPANALLIPSVGHLDGINSKWQSDIRVANTGTQPARYQLTFSPDDAAKGVKQTIITVDPGVTTALDDIIKTWYGIGSLGESANGVLEIRPLDTPGKGEAVPDQVSVSLSTQASSRTYNVTSNGTLGQFIPAIPFGSFVGRALDSAHAATVLGLQQIAQSDAYRTNVGVLEASGQPASVLITAFDSNGSKLLDFPLDLKGGEQRQLNSFLAQNHIALNDGRLQVKVTGGEGKITAYASVVDNRTGDPLLISGVPLGQNASDHFVMPGVADLNTGIAAWRTDMRVLNPTSDPQFVTLTFYPQNGNGSSQMTAVTVNPGEVKRLDNVLASTFGLTNTGGAMHVTTNMATPLVVTARTFNQTSNGTFGQFIPAVTVADAVGKSDRPLQILQAEESVRYRTNVGISEVTGKPATVEVSVFLPDSKISPSTQIPIPANGFVQIPLIQSLGLSNVYNARVSLKVVDGDGKVSAYGSVIDQRTQDPTFVPAQK